MASRQDKATTDRHARTLRELVKRPDNKFCADCKKNDARWASWNIGCFVCIRCSGIHRSMGTHISKVKSVDLDTWTPEQMESIMKWGNARANTYWEAHLKAGHAPPDHKIESFIRSKYESRRWAMEGPPPSDPSVLDGAGGGGVSADTPAPPPILPPSAVNAAKPAPAQAAPPVQSSATASLTYAQQQARQLLSPAMSGRPSAGQATPIPGTGVTASSPAAPPVQSANELFTLDFHSAPISSTNTTAESFPRKDVKQDILSLFSSQPVTAPPSSAFGAYGTTASASVPTPASAQPGMGWDSLGAVSNQPPPQQSMLGSSGTGMWGASSGWAQPTAAAPASNNIWSSPSGSTATAQQLGQFNSNDVWGGSGAASASAPAKKDDSFSDIWGGFK